MIDVFPTPWSPRNTSLYFASGDMLGAEDAAAVVVGIDLELLSAIFLFLENRYKLLPVKI